MAEVITQELPFEVEPAPEPEPAKPEPIVEPEPPIVEEPPKIKTAIDKLKDWLNRLAQTE